MIKVYVRFGEIDDNTHTVVYEGILEENEVRLLTPKTNYKGCTTLADGISFNDENTYIVDGDLVGNDDKGRKILSNISIIRKLTYDPKLEVYVWKLINHKKPIEKPITFKQIEKSVDDAQNELIEKIGVWKYIWASMTAGQIKGTGLITKISLIILIILMIYAAFDW